MQFYYAAFTSVVVPSHHTPRTSRCFPLLCCMGAPTTTRCCRSGILSGLHLRLGCMPASVVACIVPGHQQCRQAIVPIHCRWHHAGAWHHARHGGHRRMRPPRCHWYSWRRPGITGAGSVGGNLRLWCRPLVGLLWPSLEVPPRRVQPLPVRCMLLLHRHRRRRLCAGHRCVTHRMGCRCCCRCCCCCCCCCAHGSSSRLDDAAGLPTARRCVGGVLRPRRAGSFSQSGSSSWRMVVRVYGILSSKQRECCATQSVAMNRWHTPVLSPPCLCPCPCPCPCHGASWMFPCFHDHALRSRMLAE